MLNSKNKKVLRIFLLKNLQIKCKQNVIKLLKSVSLSEKMTRIYGILTFF